MTAPVWYVARILQPFADFSAGERVAVRQVGHDFQVCTLAGLHLTTLTVDEAVKALKSERGPDGYLMRVDAPETLEAHIALKNRPQAQAATLETVPHSPGLKATVRFMSGRELAEIGLPVRNGKREVVGWRCWSTECAKEFLFADYPTFREQPKACPVCGCPIFEAVYQ